MKKSGIVVFTILVLEDGNWMIDCGIEYVREIL